MELITLHKQPTRGVLREKFCENMQQMYRRIPIPKCDFNNFIEITLQDVCSPINLLHILKTPFYKNTSGGLLP